MARRTHKKSRNGCLECKRRHVKCDEKRPICSNCTASERQCEYGTCILSKGPRRPFPRAAAPGPGQASASLPTGTPGSEPFQSQFQSPSQSPSQFSSPSPTSLEDGPANMLHVTLLQNLLTKTHLTFDPTRSLPWLTEICSSSSIATPYLVNELLAFSALHMSTQATSQKEREYYHYHAAQLQTYALDLFKEASAREGLGGGGQVTQDSAVPVFLFSSVLGVHMLCDTLVYHTTTTPSSSNFNSNNDFEAFLSRFTHYLHLHAGVHAVLGSGWSMLTSPTCPIKPAFDTGMALYKFSEPLQPHFKHLLSLICSSNLGHELEGVYRQALKTLQSCSSVASSKYEGQGHAGINGVIAWPVMVGLGFCEALERRAPEGLVLLAYYAVLLHGFRGCWVVGDSGSWIIENVRRVLGEEFEEWLVWPSEVLNGDQACEGSPDDEL
ncbi:hypothetical protein BDV06DRAFT_224321 [Aspergillus oleicola]